MPAGIKCATCSELFGSEWLLDAHQKGHDDALAWCMELQRLKLNEVDLDLDDLEDYSHLYGGSSDESEEGEEEGFNFDFSSVKQEEPTLNQNQSNNDNKYDPMNYEDDEEDVVPKVDFDDMPDLEWAGPPDLEELPPLTAAFHDDDKPLDDLIGDKPPVKSRPKRKLRIPAKRLQDEDDDDYQTEDKDDSDYEEENSPPRKFGRRRMETPDQWADSDEVKEDTVWLSMVPVPTTPSKVDRSDHIPGQPKKCKFCEKTFRSFAQLDQHERCHTGEKPYVCQYCHKTFRQKAHLTTHVRIHTGARPYNCKMCDKGFIQSQHLKNHMRLHTGEKPFMCTICKKYFSQISNLRHHESGHKRKGEMD